MRQSVPTSLAASPGNNNLIGNNSGLTTSGNYGGLTQTLALLPNSMARRNGGAITTVSMSAGGSDTTIYVNNAAAIASTPGQYFILIDGEEMLVTNVNLAFNTLTVTRTLNGVSANTISIGDAVYLFTDQRSVNRPILRGHWRFPGANAAGGITVTTMADSSVQAGVSLLNAVNLANAAPGSATTIFIASNVTTITLTASLYITTGTTITIDGPVTLNGNGTSKLFNIAAGRRSPWAAAKRGCRDYPGKCGPPLRRHLQRGHADIERCYLRQ